MRLAVFSDSHGNIKGMRESMAVAGKVSGILHLGDGVEDGKRVAEESGVEFWGVRGNEDYGNDSPGSLLVRSEGWRIMLIHGHQWEINPYQPGDEWDRNMAQLVGAALEAGARCLLFGHTHRCYLEERNGVLLCNPGHLYKGAVEDHTFAILGIDADRLIVQIIEKNRLGRRSLKTVTALNNAT